MGQDQLQDSKDEAVDHEEDQGSGQSAKDTTSTASSSSVQQSSDVDSSNRSGSSKAISTPRTSIEDSVRPMFDALRSTLARRAEDDTRPSDVLAETGAQFNDQYQAPLVDQQVPPADDRDTSPRTAAPSKAPEYVLRSSGGQYTAASIPRTMPACPEECPPFQFQDIDED